MGNLLLCWPNRCTFGVLTASSQEPALPVTNLANDQGAPEQGWQTLAGVTTASFACDGSTDGPLRALGLFRTNLTATATVRWQVYAGSGALVWDSGVQPAGIVPGYRQTVAVAPLGTAGRRVVCTISDPANPDGHLNVPLACIADGWQPARNFDYNSAPGRTGSNVKVPTRAGGVVIRPDWVKRVWDLSLSGVKAAEVWPRLMGLDLYARGGNNVLFVSDPDSPLRQVATVFGECEPQTNVTYPPQPADARGWRALITERL